MADNLKDRRKRRSKLQSKILGARVSGLRARLREAQANDPDGNYYIADAGVVEFVGSDATRARQQAEKDLLAAINSERGRTTPQQRRRKKRKTTVAAANRDRGGR